MRVASWFASMVSLVVVAASGCGDDGGGGHDADAGIDTPPALECNVPPAALPPAGPLDSIDDYPLPDDCLTNGLGTLPGRWFVADLDELFEFSYPKFEGSCADGFHRALSFADDNDDSDGFSSVTWSDGTRYMNRLHIVFGGGFEYVAGTAACIRADGTLAYATGTSFANDPAQLTVANGTRFMPKDGAPVGLALVGTLTTWGDPAAPEPIVGYNVVVDSGLAYVVGTTGLDIIDVSDPAAPVHRGHAGGGDQGGYNDVRVVRDATHVVAYASPIDNQRTAVFDVTDPSTPIQLTDLPEYSHSVQVRVDGKRTLLYLATYTNSVPVYDITNPVEPLRLGSALVLGKETGIHDLTVLGDIIYANNTTAGMVAIDVSDGLDQPHELGRILTSYSHASWAATINGKPIVIHGDEGMTPEGGAFMRILDGDPTSPNFLHELSRYRTRPEVGIHNMQIVGTKIYVSYYQDGIRIVDIADPTAPREIAHYNTWDDATAYGDSFEGAIGVRPGDNGLVYVADLDKGLIILRETP